MKKIISALALLSFPFQAAAHGIHPDGLHQESHMLFHGFEATFLVAIFSIAAIAAFLFFREDEE